MRLTVYTDYALRVMMYLAVQHHRGAGATIEEIASAYGISRNHLTKIVHELAQHGYIETTRGRGGGARLARAPAEFSVGEIVRVAEKDFAVVACHDGEREHACVVQDACNLRQGFRRALDAFMRELDALTLDDAIGAPAATAALLGVSVPLPKPGSRGRPTADSGGP